MGVAGVAIVRLSGPGAFDVADRVFTPSSYTSIAEVPVRYLCGGVIVMQGQLLDQCLAVRFRAPGSFTGDDVVEFHLHGNMLIAEQVINLCIRHGARLASPGEFTRRAFLNGKIDLTQVEALADVLAAESEQALFIAQRQLHGELRARLQDFRERLLKVLALLELELDFVQEGYLFASVEQVTGLLDELRSFVSGLIASYQTGVRLRRGPRILLLGRPNAGKSSLFNALIGHSRALVSAIEGTTRDYLEETVSHGGVQFRFVDTAGLRATSDSIEAEGVSRALDLIATADHVLYLIDGTASEMVEAEMSRVDELRGMSKSSTFIPVLTKSDRHDRQIDGCLRCSIHDRSSLTLLLDHLLAGYSTTLADSIALVSHRQFVLLNAMKDRLDEVAYVSETELLSADLRTLLRPLSELTGDVVNDDILNLLFSSFCIGK